MKQARVWMGFAAAAVVLSMAFASFSSSEEKHGLLRHVVSFKFKEEATPDQIRKVETAFADLQNKIPFIVSYEAGTNVSPEGHDKGFTHCFILTFKTAKDRDAYLPHPAHKEFGALVGPLLDDVFVIDFWTK